jgi:hypothetical protein
MSSKAEMVVASRYAANIISPYGDGDKKINRQGCKLCASKLRAQAEKEFDDKENVTAVVNLLKEKGEEISYNAVKNHILFHYELPKKKAMIYEYARDVSEWVEGLGANRADAIKGRIGVLDREAVHLATASQGLALAERQKSLEVLTKIYASVEKLEKALLEVEKARDPVALVVNQLQIIIQKEAEITKTPEVRRVIVNILDQLQSKLGDMKVE